ncbi:hypothetical protein P43SY_007294 [Pythium insidiosum]|uniref:Anoctamin transmembrane domain-containing protein n=1 Tax=Pythium insidiosum TaxID=114742 RepID=A0AAD5L7G9_PYTIN|nr:hypothetical protein P43SY_007294 [Pythium insidiosum]
MERALTKGYIVFQDTIPTPLAGSLLNDDNKGWQNIFLGLDVERQCMVYDDYRQQRELTTVQQDDLQATLQPIWRLIYPDHSADTWVALRSLPGGCEQSPHLDFPPLMRKTIDSSETPVGLLLALQPNTMFISFGWNRYFAQKSDREEIHLNPGDLLLFRGDLIHAVSSSTSLNRAFDSSYVFQYFGPKLAMYFAWLECYTDALFAPAVNGAIMYLLIAHWHLRVRIAALAIVVALGTPLFTDAWKRRLREVEYMCLYQHVMETDAVVDLETRPYFRGEWVQDAVTKRRLFDFPYGKRLRQQLLAIPLLLVMCALVGAYVVALHLLSDWPRAAFPMCFLRAKPAAAELAERGLTSTTCLALSQGPGVLNAVIIQLMDNWYQRLARRLNEYENYRTQAEFDEHLVMNRMPFPFVNSNASL